MMLNEDGVRAKIAQYEKERDEFIMNANKQIAAFNGAIAVLHEILEVQESPEEPVEVANGS